MTARAGRILRGGIIALAFACPFLAHYALATGQGLHLVAAIVSAQLLAAAFVLPGGERGPLRWLALAGGAVAFASAFLAAQPVLVGDDRRHARLHSRQPAGVVRQFSAARARSSRDLAGPTGPGLAGAGCRGLHARRHQGLVRVLRRAAWRVRAAGGLRPIAIWSWFVNVLDLPLVGLMFLAEYAFRVRRFRQREPATLAQTIKAFRLRAAGEA